MVLVQLEHQRDKLKEIEPDAEVRRQIREHQQMRDSLVLEGIELGISEVKLARAAGISRMWVYKLKKKRTT